MIHTNNLTTKPLHPIPVYKPMLLGAGIGLALISLFLLGAGKSNPAWGDYWRLRPLIIVPLAGATAGVFYYLMDYLRYRGGWRMILANVLSLLVLLIGLWLGSVLGLVGTYWH